MSAAGSIDHLRRHGAEHGCAHHESGDTIEIGAAQ